MVSYGFDVWPHVMAPKLLKKNTKIIAYIFKKTIIVWGIRYRDVLTRLYKVSENPYASIESCEYCVQTRKKKQNNYKSQCCLLGRLFHSEKLSAGCTRVRQRDYYYSGLSILNSAC